MKNIYFPKIFTLNKHNLTDNLITPKMYDKETAVQDIELGELACKWQTRKTVVKNYSLTRNKLIQFANYQHLTK